MRHEFVFFKILYGVPLTMPSFPFLFTKFPAIT